MRRLESLSETDGSSPRAPHIVVSMRSIKTRRRGLFGRFIGPADPLEPIVKGRAKSVALPEAGVVIDFTEDALPGEDPAATPSSWGVGIAAPGGRGGGPRRSR